jgi:hypothetical protein
MARRVRRKLKAFLLATPPSVRLALAVLEGGGA